MMSYSRTKIMKMGTFWNRLQEYLLLVSVVVMVMTSFIESATIGPERYEDVSFPRVNVVFNQTVTCGDNKPSRFIAATFTCNDIRVDGHRLAYGYYAGWVVGADEKRCQETSGVHEFGQLCRELLASIDKESMGLRAVYVPKSTCSFLNETRKLLKKTSDDTFEWRNFRQGWGWTDTIQCMTASSPGQDNNSTTTL